jgi:hypothetical protein
VKVVHADGAYLNESTVYRILQDANPLGRLETTSACRHARA